MQSWLTLRENPGKLDRSDVMAVQDRRSERRAERWAIRRGMRSLAKGRSAGCGLPGGRPDGSVVLRVTDATGTPAEATTGANGRIAGFSGLWTCGLVWMCPECSVRIGAKRAEEVATVLAHHLANGGDPLLITLTMRHHLQHSLAECLEALRVAWEKVTQGRGAQEDYRLRGLRGWVRALEVTYSVENGWHVHLHILMVVEQGMSDDAIEVLTGGWFARWSAGLVKAGLPAPTEERGLDVQRAAPGNMAETSVSWARYVCKGLATEAIMGSTKAARGTSRSIYELMRDATIGRRFENPDTGQIVQLADLQARALLAEYEQAIRGRKQLTWSQRSHDLRNGLDMEELEDEDIVAEELEGEDVAVLPRETWSVIEHCAPELLDVTERHGIDAARAWLDDLGVEWWLPTGLTDTRRVGVVPGRDG